MSGQQFLDYGGLGKYNAKIQQELSKIESIPSYAILAYSGTAETIPSGWAICDGQNGTPDLRGRFILGASDDYTVGDTGGSDTHTLTVDELPTHHHSVAGVTVTENGKGGSLFSGGEDEISPSTSVDTSDTGEGEAIDIMPPYYALVYIMKLP